MLDAEGVAAVGATSLAVVTFDSDEVGIFTGFVKTGAGGGDDEDGESKVEDTRSCFIEVVVLLPATFDFFVPLLVELLLSAGSGGR